MGELIHKAKGAANEAIGKARGAQSWNHDFFWKSMKPWGGGAVTGDLKLLIEHHSLAGDKPPLSPSRLPASSISR